MVGKICGAPKAKSVHCAFAVTEPDRREIESEEIDRSAVKSVGDQPRHRGFRITGVEDVAETVPDICNGFSRAVNGNLTALPEIKRAYVVEAHDMVGMRMREQNGIHSFDPGAQGLLAQIGRGVNKDAVAPVFHQNGRPQPVIARVSGGANRAMAADGRHSDAGARAEHGNADRLSGHLRTGLPFGLFLARAGLSSGIFFLLLGSLDEAETQFGNGIVEQALLFHRTITARLLLQHR